MLVYSFTEECQVGVCSVVVRYFQVHDLHDTSTNSLNWQISIGVKTIHSQLTGTTVIQLLNKSLFKHDLITAQISHDMINYERSSEMINFIAGVEYSSKSNLTERIDAYFIGKIDKGLKHGSKIEDIHWKIWGCLVLDNEQSYLSRIAVDSPKDNKVVPVKTETM